METEVYQQIATSLFKLIEKTSFQFLVNKSLAESHPEYKLIEKKDEAEWKEQILKREELIRQKEREIEELTKKLSKGTDHRSESMESLGKALLAVKNEDYSHFNIANSPIYTINEFDSWYSIVDEDRLFVEVGSNQKGQQRREVAVVSLNSNQLLHTLNTSNLYCRSMLSTQKFILLGCVDYPKWTFFKIFIYDKCTLQLVEVVNTRCGAFSMIELNADLVMVGERWGHVELLSLSTPPSIIHLLKLDDSVRSILKTSSQNEFAFAIYQRGIFFGDVDLQKKQLRMKSNEQYKFEKKYIHSLLEFKKKVIACNWSDHQIISINRSTKQCSTIAMKNGWTQPNSFVQLGQSSCAFIRFDEGIALMNLDTDSITSLLSANPYLWFSNYLSLKCYENEIALIFLEYLKSTSIVKKMVISNK